MAFPSHFLLLLYPLLFDFSFMGGIINCEHAILTVNLILWNLLLDATFLSHPPSLYVVWLQILFVCFFHVYPHYFTLQVYCWFVLTIWFKNLSLTREFSRLPCIILWQCLECLHSYKMFLTVSSFPCQGHFSSLKLIQANLDFVGCLCARGWQGAKGWNSFKGEINGPSSCIVTNCRELE